MSNIQKSDDHNKMLHRVAAGLAWISQFHQKHPDLVASYSNAWVEQMFDGGVDADYVYEAFKRHASKSEFWPKPSEIITIARSLKREVVRRQIETTKALPEPTKLMTKEERKAILANMKNDDAREYFLKVVEGGERERTRRFTVTEYIVTEEDKMNLQNQIKRLKGQC